MTTRKFFIDLWASTASHILVAEWMPVMPHWAASGLVILLTSLIIVLLLRSRKRAKAPKLPRRYRIDGGPDGLKLEISRRPVEKRRPKPNAGVKG
jgi:hypothetical protein